jgi:hypothetical protein
MVAERVLRIPALLGLLFATACASPPVVVSPELLAATERSDALLTSDALEALIERGADTPSDRKYAYEAVRNPELDTAAYAFARAAVTGRLVQQLGLGVRISNESSAGRCGAESSTPTSATAPRPACSARST